MRSHRVRVTQIFRVEREIVVCVEAQEVSAAIDLQTESEAPAFDDARWRSSWTLENEEVVAAGDGDGDGADTSCAAPP